MSNYWDAVGRVARGLPGSAEPRPRSIFESDAPFVASDGLDAIEQEVDAPPLPTAAVRSVQRGSAPAPDPAAAEPPIPPADMSRSPAPLPAHPRDAGKQPDSRAHGAEPDRPASTLERVAPPPAPEPTPATRVEVRHIDTTQTTLRLIETRAQSAEPEPVAPSMTAQAVPARHDDRREQPAAAIAIEPPPVVVAEPVAAVPAPIRQEPAPEPPALVIEIGRIDIRIASDSAAPPVARKRQDSAPTPSLDDYLTRRRGVGP